MGAPQSPSTTPTFPATITPPANSDPCDATQLNTDVETPLQNGVEAARLLTYGGGLRRIVQATDNNTMVIQPLGAVIVTVAGAWTARANLSPSTIDPEALAGGAFAASTRYYVYVALVAGALTFSVSTTAPDAGRRYKTGDTQYQFVSTFYTNAAMNLLPYKQNDSEYIYSSRTLAGAVDGNLILNNGTAAIVTTVSIGGSAPSTATGLLIQHQATATANFAYSNAGFAVGNQEYIQSALNPWNASGLAGGCFPLDYVSSIEYINDANTTHAFLWVAGFTY